ncbi:MAG: HD domain-containing protein [Thaumarchaeota archaeon]|nr:HD domain-containing protein [Nitrososphaerota archaeon]
MNDASLEHYVRKKVAANDPAHDFAHIMRVCRNAAALAKTEGADPRLVIPAALLHDIVSYPKSDPRSSNSSSESARLARRILGRRNFTPLEIEEISDAIADHSYSRGAVPRTLTGKILQDADRLDAIGAIGIARAFTVGGSERRALYSPSDPSCSSRAPDDKKWTLDHFYKKLLLLEEGMNTRSARREARRRSKTMRNFLSEFLREV